MEVLFYLFITAIVLRGVAARLPAQERSPYPGNDYTALSNYNNYNRGAGMKRRPVRKIYAQA